MTTERSLSYLPTPSMRVLSLVKSVPPLVWAVLASRLLIVAAGALTTALAPRVYGWSMFDPLRLSSSLGPVGNALTSASLRWDALHYLSVAEHGYKPAGDTQFFPLYPMLIRVFGWMVGSDVVAAMLVSATAFGVGLVLLHRLTRDELGERAATATVLLLAFAPLSFFFTAIYTESLLLALTVAAFFLMRRGHFLPACVVATFAALTHGDGFLVVAPLAFTYWERRGRPRNVTRLMSWEALGLLLPICAFLGFFVYEHAIGFGWLAPVTSSQSIGHARMMVVNSRNASSYGSTNAVPVVTFWHAFTAATSGLWQIVHGTSPFGGTMQGPFNLGFQNVVYLAVLVVTLLTLAVSWRRLPAAYSIYATLAVALYTERNIHVVPLLSFDRYMLPIFPLWMGAGAWLQERNLTRRAVELSMVLLVFYTIEFAKWVPIA